MFFIVFLSILNFSTSASNTPYNKLKSLMHKEIGLLKQLLESKKEVSDSKEALTIIKSERLELMKRKDSEYLRIAGIKKAVRKHKLKIKKLVEIIYKIENGRHKYFISPFAPSSVANNGSDVILKALKAEINIVKRLQNNISSLKQNRTKLAKNIALTENLIDSLKRRISEKDTAFARAKFEIKTIEKERNKYPKTMYDKSLWDLWSKIIKLRKQLKIKNFYLLKGLLVRPVSGSYLRSLYQNKGVYISAKVGSGVRAPEAGTVKFLGKINGYGLVMVLEHRNSYFSLIGGLTSPLVRTGQKVRRAQVIARVAPMGKLKYVALYYELRKGATYLNPEIWLGY